MTALPEGLIMSGDRRMTRAEGEVVAQHDTDGVVFPDAQLTETAGGAGDVGRQFSARMT